VKRRSGTPCPVLTGTTSWRWGQKCGVRCVGLPFAAETLVTGKGRTVEGYVLRDAPGWTWKANGRDNQGRFDFVVVEHLAYGAGPPLHFHTEQEDSFFVLEGVLTVQLETTL